MRLLIVLLAFLSLGALPLSAQGDGPVGLIFRTEDVQKDGNQVTMFFPPEEYRVFPSRNILISCSSDCSKLDPGGLMVASEDELIAVMTHPYFAANEQPRTEHRAMLWYPVGLPLKELGGDFLIPRNARVQGSLRGTCEEFKAGRVQLVLERGRESMMIPASVQAVKGLPEPLRGFC